MATETASTAITMIVSGRVAPRRLQGADMRLTRSVRPVLEKDGGRETGRLGPGAAARSTLAHPVELELEAADVEQVCRHGRLGHGVVQHVEVDPCGRREWCRQLLGSGTGDRGPPQRCASGDDDRV